MKSSITGDIKATLFEQDGNLPPHEDGPASLQLSMLSFKQILEFSPVDHKFNIPLINTKLNHLFVLATTHDRRLTDAEHIQHTLTVYARIKQPETWAQWVRNQIDAFDEGTLTNCQSFMNSASLKFTEIASSDSGFNGSITTVQEDIVAMVTTNKRKKAIASIAELPPNNSNASGANKGKLPPFAKHFKSSTEPDAQTYKVGNTKTWHFCDCPNHRDRVKWHTHPAETCRLRLRWLANERGGPPSMANVVASDISTTITDPTNLGGNGDRSTATDQSDVTALLAAALSHTDDNSAACDLIADTLNALHHA